MSGTPQRRQKTPMVASALMTRRSHHSASSRPPATQKPSTAATVGFVARACAKHIKIPNKQRPGRETEVKRIQGYQGPRGHIHIKPARHRREGAAQATQAGKQASRSGSSRRHQQQLLQQLTQQLAQQLAQQPQQPPRFVSSTESQRHLCETQARGSHGPGLEPVTRHGGRHRIHLRFAAGGRERTRAGGVELWQGSVARTWFQSEAS